MRRIDLSIGDVFAFDLAEGEHIVVEKDWEPGMGTHDPYPGYWKFAALKLAADGTYDPAGQRVEFHEAPAGISQRRSPSIVKKLRRMTMTFI